MVERLPTGESLMPALSYHELAGNAEPAVAEQLIAPNALRQRRSRERQRAELKDAQKALQALRPRVSNTGSGEATSDGEAAP